MGQTLIHLRWVHKDSSSAAVERNHRKLHGTLCHRAVLCDCLLHVTAKEELDIIVYRVGLVGPWLQRFLIKSLPMEDCRGSCAGRILFPFWACKDLLFKAYLLRHHTEGQHLALNITWVALNLFRNESLILCSIHPFYAGVFLLISLDLHLLHASATEWRSFAKSSV